MSDLKQATRDLQSQLTALGFSPGPIDGAAGPKTGAALQAFFDRAKLGFRVEVRSGEIRINGPLGLPAATRPEVDSLPWMQIARSVLGLHETRDNAALRRFLASDGHALGDPAKLPWCGDFVETCIKTALPREVFEGTLGLNPYFARNWRELGVKSEPTYGAVVVFERGPNAGHVGFLVGQDDTSFYVLGGNQSDGVTIARISKSRAIGIRWPKTFPAQPVSLPRMIPGQTQLSTNEA